MRIVKILFDFYLDASIHVAFAVLAFYHVSLINFNIPETKNLDFVIFLSTIITYNFIKYGSRAKGYVIVTVKYEKIIQGFSFFAGILLGYFLLGLSVAHFVMLAFLALLCLLYILPFSYKGKNLRSMFTLKVYLVALVWSVCTVILLFGDFWPLLSFDVWLTFVQRFLFVLVLILPFEIRDMPIDTHYLRTIPIKIGVKNTKKLGYFVICFIAGLEFLKTQFFVDQFLILLATLAITALLLKYTRKDQSPYYTKFVVESVPILYWAVSAVLLRFF